MLRNSSGLNDIHFSFANSAYTIEEFTAIRPMSKGERETYWPNGFLYLPRFECYEELMSCCVDKLQQIERKYNSEERVLCIVCLNVVYSDAPYPDLSLDLQDIFPKWDFVSLDTTCYGWAFAFKTAQSYLQNDHYEKVIYVAASARGMGLHAELDLSYINYCDAICVLEFSTQAEYELVSFASHTDSRFAAMSYEQNFRKKLLLQRDLVDAEWQNFFNAISQALGTAAISITDVQSILIPFITPSSEEMLFQHLGATAKAKHKVPSFQEVGLIAGIGCLREFHEHHQNKAWVPGDRIILCTMGYAYSWATVILEKV